MSNRPYPSSGDVVATVAQEEAPPASSGPAGGAGTFPPPAPRVRAAAPKRDDDRALIAAAFPDPIDDGELTVQLVEAIKRSPRFLDKLAELPEDHALRAGTRFKVLHYPPGGNPRTIIGAWDHDVPTEEYLGRLIAEGGLPAGRYVVQPVIAGRHGARIEMVLHPIGLQGQGPTDLVQRLLDRLAPPPHAVQLVDEQLTARVDQLQDLVEQLQADKAALQARVEQAEALALGGLDQEQGDDSETAGGLLGGDVIARAARGMTDAVLDRIKPRDQAPTDVEFEHHKAPGLNGTSYSGHRSDRL